MKPNERVEFASLPRRTYERLFNFDQSVALQAAYTLVASSKSGSKSYALGLFKHLSKGEVDQLREDLEKLLQKLGDRFYSTVELVDAKRSNTGLDAKVRIRYTRRLPLTMNGHAVIIPKPDNLPPWDAKIEVTSLPSAKIEVDERLGPKDPEWKDGDVLIANCSIHLPPKNKDLDTLPIAYAVGGDVKEEQLPLKTK